MVFLCVRNRLNICHMQMHETFAIWYCTLRNAMYMPPDFDIKPQQLQHKVEWNEGAQHETCLQIPWDNRQQACVRWSMTMPSTVIQTKDWSCLNHLCSMSTKGCILQCQTKGIPIDMSSTNQRQHNPIFLLRTYTPKRFWSHGWYGLAGSSSLTAFTIWFRRSTASVGS